MQYMVTGMDGKEYGPSDLDTLRSWVAENRLAPHTTVRDFNTGQTMPASSIPGLFAPEAPLNVPPVGGAYPRGLTPTITASSRNEGGGAFAGVVIRSILGVVLFFVLHGIGLIVAGSGMITAFQLKGQGSKWGVPALMISGIAVVVISVGWMLRLSSGNA